MRTGAQEKVVRKILNTIIMLEEGGICSLHTIQHPVLIRLRRLPTRQRIQILQEAIGNNVKRKHAALLLLPELLSTADVEDMVAALLVS